MDRKQPCWGIPRRLIINYMETAWFCLVALMLAVYVLLDGFDLGAGVIHLLAARDDRERREILASIGPFWDGNEVWLVAAGGTLYFAFPALYASGFSGFYLALMIVLWLLMLRGISIELRSHVDSDLWATFWDAVFCGASALLAIFYGAALGNVVRGVPIDANGFFFTPLWTNFQPGAAPGIVDWYTALVGLAALGILTLHGALWVALKTAGALQKRSRAIASQVWLFVCAIVLAISVISFRVQPRLARSFADRPWMWILPAIAATGLAGLRLYLKAGKDLLAFVGSSVFIASLLGSAVFALYPAVLPSVPDASRSLTVYNAAAPAYGLAIGFWWWTPAFLLAAGYSVFVYRHFRGKVEVG
jgi:cytochrome bd ubiquinol oxidase subunit II